MKLTKPQEEALVTLWLQGSLYTTSGPESSDTKEGIRASTLYALEKKHLVRRTSKGAIYSHVTWRVTPSGREEAKKISARPKTEPEVLTPARVWKGLTKNMRTSLTAMMNPEHSQYAEHYGGGLFMKTTGWFVLDGNTTNALRDRGLVEKSLAARYDKDDGTIYDNVTVAKLTDLGREVGAYGLAQRQENPEPPPLTDPGAVSRLKF